MKITFEKVMGFSNPFNGIPHDNSVIPLMSLRLSDEEFKNQIINSELNYKNKNIFDIYFDS